MIIYSSERLVQPTNHNQKNMVRVISTYIDQARANPVPKKARETAHKCIFDLLSAVCAGITDSGAISTRTTAVNIMGKGDFPIWFCGQSSSAIGAAWANSAAAAIQDLDDGHRLARGHPGAAVIPTAFAIAQEVGATVEQLLNAIVIGYEVGVTIASARKVYGNTGVWSSYAVVATAAVLRQSSCEVIEHALAIAGESSPNQAFASCAVKVPVPEGSYVKEGIPWSVVSGLVALALAESGHTGPRNILDSITHYHFEKVSLPSPELHISNTYFKLYACCRHIHAPLDALISLLQKNDITVSAIETIHVDTYSGALRISNRSKPVDLIDVQYSIPYCLALAAIIGSESLLPLTDKVLNNHHVSELARKVKLSIDPELDALFPAKTLARVTVMTASENYVSDITAPSGEADNPLSWQMLENKFRAVSERVNSNGQQLQILNAANELYKGELTPLMNCFSELKLTY